MEAEADWQRQGLTVHVDKADSVFLDLTWFVSYITTHFANLPTAATNAPAQVWHL